jgi:hypothetical protein
MAAINKHRLTAGEGRHMATEIESDRRSLLKGAGAAMLVIAGNAVMSPREAWGLASTSLRPTTLQTMIQMARDIYPHDRLADRFYAVAIKDFDVKAAKDAKMAEMLEAGVADLDKRATAAGAASYTALKDYPKRLALLKAIEAGPFFQAIRGSLVTGLYNQKEVWPVFGYEGESASKGGYLQRGFNDIEWL